MSTGITPPFSLIQAHAPVLDPPRASEKPRTQGLCRLPSAPAGNSTFPTLSPRIFPHVLGPLPRLLLWCSYPFLPTKRRPSRNLEPVGANAFAFIAVNPYSNFSTAHFTRLQSFTHVQARRFARHPDCSYRSESVFRVLEISFRVRWLFHRFRFGPQSDSRCLSRNPGNPPGSRDFYFRAYLSSLPPRAADMLTVRFGQLTAEGLTPS